MPIRHPSAALRVDLASAAHQIAQNPCSRNRERRRVVARE